MSSFTGADESAAVAAALAKVAATAEALSGTITTAEALARARRRIDLAGLDQRVGRLCAAILDLPPAEGRGMRPALLLLLARIDSLLPLVAVAP